MPKINLKPILKWIINNPEKIVAVIKSIKSLWKKRKPK